MRLVTTLTLSLLLAPAALAQPCDPANTSEPCPDTTAADRYVPLEVGNQWQYYQPPFEEPATHWSWRITGETEIGGQTYFELVRCDEAEDGSADCAAPVPIRYDAEHAMIVRRDGDVETWWHELPCRLDGDFNGEAVCTGPGAESFVLSVIGGTYGAAVEVPPDEVSGDTRKLFEEYPGTGPELYAGLGATAFHYDLVEHPTRLVHAIVGGEQVGTPAFATCDPSEPGDIACPDTTDWRRYMPLAAGNEWQFREAIDYDEIVYWGWRISGETEIGGRTYFELERCNEAADGTVTCGEAQPVRYSDEYARVVRYGEDGDRWWPGVPCELALPFGEMTGAEYYECIEGVFERYFSVEGEYDTTWDLPPDVVSGNTLKHFGVGPMDGVTLYAGIGPVEFEDEYHPEATRLVYARIDGEAYGTAAFSFPLSDEPAASPAAFALRAVYPNPAREAATVAFTLDRAQDVTLEVLDVLGRVVRTEEVGPQAGGPHEARLATAALPSGLYLVRLRGDGAEATRRLVVLR